MSVLFNEPDWVLLRSGSATAFLDAHPVTEGHARVTPRQHVSSIYELPSGEHSELWELVATVRLLLMERLQVDSLNIGVNDGLAAGQAVEHAHIHVIPRRPGEVSDPRRRIRLIVADKAKY